MLVKKLVALVEGFFSDLNIEELEDARTSINAILAETPYADIEVVSVSQDFENKATYVEFNDTSSGDSLTLVFFVDEEGLPMAAVAEDFESDSEEIDALDLTDLNPLIADGMIVFKDLSWFDPSILEFLLEEDQIEEGKINELSITVVRGGKKVKKQLVRKKRKKRLTPQRRMAIKKAVRIRKLKNAQIQRKRKRSLKIRNRSNLKNKPKKMRVV